MTGMAHLFGESRYLYSGISLIISYPLLHADLTNVAYLTNSYLYQSNELSLGF